MGKPKVSPKKMICIFSKIYIPITNTPMASTTQSQLICEACEQSNAPLRAVMYPGSESTLTIYCMKCLSKPSNKKEVAHCRIFEIGKEVSSGGTPPIAPRSLIYKKCKYFVWVFPMKIALGIRSN